MHPRVLARHDKTLYGKLHTLHTLQLRDPLSLPLSFYFLVSTYPVRHTHTHTLSLSQADMTRAKQLWQTDKEKKNALLMDAYAHTSRLVVGRLGRERRRGKAATAAACSIVTAKVSRSQMLTRVIIIAPNSLINMESGCYSPIPAYACARMCVCVRESVCVHSYIRLCQ